MSRNPSRYIAPRQPKTLAQLDRPQLCGRIAALRSALDTLASQSDLDGAEVFDCLGRMKVTLIGLEQRLRDMDRGEPAQSFSAAVTVPAAQERLQRAQAELDQVRSPA